LNYALLLWYYNHSRKQLIVNEVDSCDYMEAKMETLHKIIEAIFIWSPVQRDGYRELTGYKKYLIVKDENDKMICFGYNRDIGKSMIDAYLEAHDMEKEGFKFQVATLTKKALESSIDYKVVYLDNEAVLYKQVRELAESGNIVNWSNALPNGEFVKYTRINR